MSQQDVALGSGLERAYISAIEHGKHNITLGAVMKLSDALRVPFEELLVGGAEDAPR
jgi:transcriptional regulator with XRE-family HTH domain